MDKFQEERIALSLPSLRLDSKLKETLEETQKVRKTSLTYAMEAGTQRLRDVINKGITEENLMSSVSDAFAGGWSSVKLYFMFGLPTETTEDLNGIADLASKVVRKYFETPKNVRARGLRVNCSASCFVPKPFTPFQWEPQDTIEQFEEKTEASVPDHAHQGCGIQLAYAAGFLPGGVFRARRPKDGRCAGSRMASRLPV